MRKNPLINLLSKTWHYSENNKSKIVIFWAMFVIANLIGLLSGPLLWAKIINIITREGINQQNIGHLFVLLSLTFVIEFSFWCFHGPARLIERTNAFIARANYRKYLLKGVMTLPIEWHVDHHSGDTIDKVEKGTSGLYSFSETIFLVISAVIQLIVSYTMLIYFSPSSAFIVLGMILISIWITIRFDRVIVDQYKQLNRYENNVSEGVFDAISNITTVIILRVERLVFKALVSKIEKPFELYKKNNRLTELKWFLTNMCCSIMTILVLGAYFWQHLGATKGILVGSVYLLINYLGKTSEIFFKFTSMYGEILQRNAKVTNSEELAKDFIDENFTNHVLPNDWKRLEVKNLNFSYGTEEASSLHLDDISISINKGEKIALIGDSGSGKTTFLKVIRDLYHPRSLTLAIDGKVVSHGFEGICQGISLVPQNPEIFATSILDNITLGADYDEKFVSHFTDIACFSDVVEKLPRKFNTSIKEKGVNLSGGQQQRLALSRGLLACHNKDIILLDEPTSSLDPGTEMKVYQNIFREFFGKTIVSTIHRTHLLPLFDKIYFFSEGKIIGSGNHDLLLQISSNYKEMWELQTNPGNS